MNHSSIYIDLNHKWLPKGGFLFLKKVPSMPFQIEHSMRLQKNTVTATPNLSNNPKIQVGECVLVLFRASLWWVYEQWSFTFCGALTIHTKCISAIEFYWSVHLRIHPVWERGRRRVGEETREHYTQSEREHYTQPGRDRDGASKVDVFQIASQ